MKRKKNFREWLITLMIAVLVLIAAAAAFLVLKPVLVRFSMDFYYPVLKTVRAAEDTASEKLLLLKSKTELVHALSRLQQENLVLEAENASLYRFQQENTNLRANAGLNPPAGFRAVQAEILTRDPADWKETFTIDRGRDDGIREGDLVVASARSDSSGKILTGAVGRIISASNHSSVVVTLFNPECSIGSTQAESGAYGVLSGSASDDRVLIGKLPVNARYGVGEIVMTSGFSENIPASVFLGTIAADANGAPAVRKTADGLCAEAEMKPLLDLTNLRFVVVLSGRIKQ